VVSRKLNRENREYYFEIAMTRAMMMMHDGGEAHLSLTMHA